MQKNGQTDRWTDEKNEEKDRHRLYTDVQTNRQMKTQSDQIGQRYDRPQEFDFKMEQIKL